MTPEQRLAHRILHHVIPPDREGMNGDRAAWAGVAITAFIKAVRCDPEDAVADLLVDIMHWCDRNGTDFIFELERSRHMYRDETS